MSSKAIWTASEAAVVTNNTNPICEDWQATGLSIDSRTVKKGDLFVAIKGHDQDGHDYVEDALKKGAAAAIVSKDIDGTASKVLKVEDTLNAMEKLAVAARERSAAKVIAVTGSVGKTGTKMMLDTVFSALGQTHASPESYNNHWGVPFSLASMHAGTDFGVFEIGMNHAGEITPLSKMVKPDIAIITTIAPVHMEFFDNVGEIAKAKAEIFNGMGPGGVAILNRDNDHYHYLAKAAYDRGIVTRSFGRSEDADARLENLLAASNGSRVAATINGKSVEFSLAVPGEHIVMNALAVLLVVDELGHDVKKAFAPLGSITSFSQRGERELINCGDPKNPITLIDETFNASPIAMNAAFKVMALIDPGRGGRRIAILGDMLELGERAPQYHKDLALPLEAADVRLVYTCGNLMKNLHDALPDHRRGEHRGTSIELAEIVPDVLVPGDVVLVKGSKGSKMGAVVEAMRQMDQTI